MDIDNAMEPDVDSRNEPSCDAPAPPPASRWRQRGAGPVPREPGALPPDEPPERDAPAAAETPRHAPHDAELWLLARRTQGAALRLDFELRTPLLRQVFRRDFVFVSRQLHALESSRRVQGLDRAALDDALAALRRRADAVQAQFAEVATRLQDAIAASAPAGTRIAFARPARFRATIVGPTAHRYLALIRHADDTLAQLQMAWLLGLVEPARRTALVSDCRRALHGFKDLACERRAAVGALVRKINAQRKEGQCKPAAVDERQAEGAGARPAAATSALGAGRRPEAAS